ncbi:hypothetical protein Pelo_13680 [Pelomyxa schiedti]|nr:hypothetical protein Pelo_13680 [Pelomyxa schiedti]
MVTDSPTKYPGVQAWVLELIHFPMYDKQTRSDPETADLIRVRQLLCRHSVYAYSAVSDFEILWSALSFLLCPFCGAPQ